MKSFCIKWFKRSNCCAEAQYHLEFFTELPFRKMNLFWSNRLAPIMFFIYCLWGVFLFSFTELLLSRNIWNDSCRALVNTYCLGSAVVLLQTEFLPISFRHAGQSRSSRLLVSVQVFKMLSVSDVFTRRCAEKMWQQLLWEGNEKWREKAFGLVVMFLIISCLSRLTYHITTYYDLLLLFNYQQPHFYRLLSSV